jgi:glycosyltransferase involved in cell wall biosynthesis
MEQPRKRVLVITYHWPPSGGVTVLRCLKLVKYLRENGWEPVVFTARDARYPYEDPTHFRDVPEGLEVHRVAAWEPSQAFKRFSGRKPTQPLLNITANSDKQQGWRDRLGIWIRGNFFIPDARALWIAPSVRYLLRYLKEHPVDAIFTDGPPHSNTVIGLRCAQRLGIPWLADFQDPWTQVDYYGQMRIGKRADRIHRALEQEVFAQASRITIASPTWARDLQSIGARDVSVFYYGFDEADFSDYRPEVVPGRFIVFHGGLLGSDRNPIGLIEALGEAVARDAAWRERLEIRLAGEVDVSVRNAVQAAGLEPYTRYLGMLPRTAILGELGRASLLLLPINRADNAAGRIPGKLFELLRAGKPILYLGPAQGDARDLVAHHPGSGCFGYEDVAGIAEFVRGCAEAAVSRSAEEAAAAAARAAAAAEAAAPYTNARLTREIARHLDEISAPGFRSSAPRNT